MDNGGPPPSPSLGHSILSASVNLTENHKGWRIALRKSLSFLALVFWPALCLTLARMSRLKGAPMNRKLMLIATILVMFLSLSSIIWADRSKLDDHLNTQLNGNSSNGKIVSVIIQTRTAPDASHRAKIAAFGGKVKKSFKILNGIVADLPLMVLDRLSDDPEITSGFKFPS